MFEFGAKSADEDCCGGSFWKWVGQLLVVTHLTLRSTEAEDESCWPRRLLT